MGATYIEAAASLLGAIAWPVLVLVLVLMFKRPLRRALERLTKLGAAGAFAEFDQTGGEVARSLVETAADSRSASSHTATSDPATLGRTYAQLAVENPLSAILKAYSAIEEWADKHLTEHGIPAHDGMTKRDVLSRIHDAVRKGLLPESALDQVRGLSVMRSLAIHGPAERVSAANAEEYLTLADAVLYALDHGLKK